MEDTAYIGGNAGYFLDTADPDKLFSSFSLSIPRFSAIRLKTAISISTDEVKSWEYTRHLELDTRDSMKRGSDRAMLQNPNDLFLQTHGDCIEINQIRRRIIHV
jgi:hypothetical protein